MKKFIMTLFIIVLLGVGGYFGYPYAMNMLQKNTSDKPEVVAMEEVPTTTIPTISEKTEENTPLPTQIAPAPVTDTQKDITPSDTPKAIAEWGAYLPYTSTAVAQATWQVVLFFWTNWSPSCQSVSQDIEKNLATLPKDVTILKVNFDDEKDLRQLYDISIQGSFVQVDNTGKLIKKWRGSNTLAEILSQIQK